MKNIFKIKINYLTWYFLFILFLCGYIKKGIIIFLIILFHELGHIFIAKLFKYKIISIEIFPFGGVSKIDKLLNESFLTDFLIAIMGVIFQCFLFLIFKSSEFVKINLYLILFNLLPIIPLDGSKIIFEIYAYFFNYKKSIKLYYITSFIFIFLYFILNFKYSLNNYMIIILFIYKTIEVVKNKSIFYEKFILEKIFYDINYKRFKQINGFSNEFYKNLKYYYFANDKIISDREYLREQLLTK